VHRLDRFTTGVLLGAKTLAAQRALLAAFAERRVWKLYVAVCVGQPESRAAVSQPICRHPRDRLKMAVAPPGEGRPATSIVHNLATDGRLSLVAVLIRTGRTHQIRVHMQHLRCPVLGDPVYGEANWNRKEAARAARPLLHAYSLRFAHPANAEPVRVDAPPPSDLAAVGAQLAGCDPAGFSSWLEGQVEERLAYSLEGFKF